MFSAPAASPAPRSSQRAGARPASVVALAVLLLLGSVSGTSAAARPAGSGGDGTDRSGVTSDATGTVLEGLDVSHWQGTINWTSVAGAGKKFAIIKATDGQVQSNGTLYVDPMYATNHSRAKAAGLWTGAYHFARPGSNTNDAIIEADHFAANINIGAGDLIPALDLEDSGGLSVAGLQAWVASFLGEVTGKIGARPMIYTSPAFWKKYMGDSHALADAGYTTLWVAHWGVTSPTVPASNWGGHGWTFWQYTSDGTVAGISGRVDLDRFNGTDLATQAYSTFKLAASIPSGSVKQGSSAAATVSIIRLNFASDIALAVSGLPEGTTVTYDANPVDDASAALTVTTPADPAATPVGTYPLTITGAADGITRTTKLNLVIADGIPPTLTAPTTHLWANRTLGTSTVPVRIAWTATDPSGIVSTGLQRSLNGGSWTATSLPSATATAADGSIPIGGTARQRVRASDTRANTSGWLEGNLVRASVYQQSSTALTWTGTWHTSGWSGASGGTVRYATARGASATFHFTGSSVAWVAARGTTRGSAWVYVDGVYAGSVSLHATAGHSRAIVFARNWSGIGSHTLRIVVAGTAGHARVDVDAFVRLTAG
ncbi:MAG TPA: glycoside hydrolase family 25 protein [Candidatus Limnocylindrales bacterium]|nr:glycoside hydrolase family 25 protein [Candidatus Limnocylindrales bacterium]